MNKIEIEIPVGKEVDWEASAKQKKIVLKDKQLTYEDICNKLFKDGHYYTNEGGDLRFNDRCANISPNNATTKYQLECLLSLNKLINTAIYLNDRWKPNLKTDWGYVLQLNYDNTIIITKMAVKCPYSAGSVIFKSEELARQAIEILGKETVKSALSTFY